MKNANASLLLHRLVEVSLRPGSFRARWLLVLELTIWQWHWHHKRKGCCIRPDAVFRRMALWRRTAGGHGANAEHGRGGALTLCRVLVCPARSRRGISLGRRHGRGEAANCAHAAQPHMAPAGTHQANSTRKLTYSPLLPTQDRALFAQSSFSARPPLFRADNQ